MSATVDNRVVSMEFDNAQFERNVATSMQTLDQLDNKLKFENAEDSFDKITKASQGVSFQTIADALDKLNSHFSTWGIAARKVIEDVVGMAERAAGKVWSSTIGQVMSGGWTRASNIEQAKFQLEGLGIAWDQVSDSISYAVDGTAYGLDSAAKAAGQLAASGVNLGEEMDYTLRGISGVAAMSGSAYDEIAAIYESAAGKGRVMNMELTRLATKGINASSVLAKELGKTEAEVRDMASKSQISFAEFAKAMDDAYGEHAKDANKTFSGVMMNIQAALSRIGAEFATPIMTDMVEPLNRLREIIVSVKEAMQPLFDIFQTFMAGLGINLDLIGESINKSQIVKNIVEGLLNIFASFGEILITIGEGFSNAFPEITIKNIENFTEKFKNFAEGLVLSDRNVQNIRNTSEGFFSVLSGGITIITKIAYVLSPLFELLEPIATVILEVTGAIGQWVSSIVNWITESETFNKVIQIMHDVIKWFADTVSDIIMGLSTYIGPIFDRISLFFSNFVSSVKEGVGSVNTEGTKLKLDELIKTVFSKCEQIIKAFVEFLGFNYEDIKKFFQGFHFPEFDESAGLIKQTIDTVSKAITEFVTMLFGHEVTLKDIAHNIAENLLKVAEAALEFATTIIGAIDVKKIKQLGMIVFFVTALAELNNFINALVGAPTKILNSLSSIMGGIAGVLNGFSTSFKADALLKVAEAIAVLAVSVMFLAQIPAPELMLAAIALGVIMVALEEFCNSLLKITKDIDAKKLVSIAAEVVAISAGILLISFAVGNLAQFNLPELCIGLAGIGVLMLELYIFMKKIESIQATSLAGLIALGISLDLLIPVINTFANFNEGQLKKSLTGVALLLTALLVFSNAMEGDGLNLAITSVGLIGLAAAIDMLIPALVLFGLLPMDILKKGGTTLAAIGLGLLVFANAMEGNGLNMLEISASLIGLAAALTLLIIPITAFGLIPFPIIAKGVGTLAGSLLVLGGTAMILGKFNPLILKGSVAILALSGAVAVAGAAILIFSAGLAALIGVFLLLGTTVGAFSGEFSKNVTDLIVGLAKGIANSATQTAQAFLKMVLSWLQVIADNASAIVAKVVEVISSIVTAIIENIPKIVSGILETIKKVASFIIEHKSEILEAAKKMFEGFVEGVKSLVGKVLEAIKDILLKVNDAIFGFVDDIKDAASKLIGGFIDGITGKNKDTEQSGRDVAQGLIDGMEEKADEISQTGEDIGELAVEGVKDGADTHSRSDITYESGKDVDDGLIDGMAAKADKVGVEGKKVGTLSVDNIEKAIKDGNIDQLGESVPLSLISGMDEKIPLVGDKGTDMLDTLTNSVKDTIGNGVIGDQGAEVVNLFTGGINQNLPLTKDAGEQIPMTAVQALTGYADGVDISGSGRQIGESFDSGLEDTEPEINATANNLSKKLGDYGFANIDYAALAGKAQGNAYNNEINKAIGQGQTALEKATADADKYLARAQLEQKIKINNEKAAEAEKDKYLAHSQLKQIRNVTSKKKQKAAEAETKKAKIEEIPDIEVPSGSGGGSGGGSGASKAAGEVKELFDVMKDASGVIENYNKRFIELDETLDDNSEVTKNVSDGTDQAKAAVTALAEKVFESSDKYDEAMAAMDHSSAEYLSAMKEEWDSYKESLEGAITGSIDAFSEFTTSTHVDADDILDSINSQIIGIEMFKETINGLSQSNLDPDLLKDLVDGGIANMDKLMGLLYATDEQREAISNAYTTLDDITTNVTDKILASLAFSVDSHADTVREALEANEEYMDDIEKLSEIADITGSQVVVMYNEVQNSIKNVIKSGMKIFDEYEKAETVSKRTLKKNLKENKEAWEEWGNDLNELIAKGLDKAIVQNLYQAGLDSMGEIKGFKTMTEEEIGDYNEMFAEYIMIPDKISHEIAANYTATALSISNAFAEGVDQNVIEGAAVDTANTYLTALQDAVGDKANVQGSILSKSFDEGFKENARDVYDTVKDFGDKIIDDLDLSDDMDKVGYNIMKGLAGGIKDNSYLVRDALEEVNESAIDSTKKTYDEHSPSKVFYKIGSYISKGLAEGITDEKENVIDSLNMIGETAINSMQGLIGHIIDILDGELEINPEIKPVVELDDAIDEAHSVMAELYSAQQEMAAYSLANGINYRMRPDIYGNNTNTTSYNTPITINVYGGSDDAETIAEAVQNKINHEVRRLGAVS